MGWHMDQTDFLVSRATFVDGVGRLFDFAGALNVYAVSPSPQAADARALGSDFAMVGQDLRAAADVEQTHQTH